MKGLKGLTHVELMERIKQFPVDQGVRKDAIAGWDTHGENQLTVLLESLFFRTHKTTEVQGKLPTHGQDIQGNINNTCTRELEMNNITVLLQC